MRRGGGGREVRGGESAQDSAVTGVDGDGGGRGAAEPLEAAAAWLRHKILILVGLVLLVLLVVLVVLVLIGTTRLPLVVLLRRPSRLTMRRHRALPDTRFAATPRCRRGC
jgi:Flp pilus assembly protein TadB